MNGVEPIRCTGVFRIRERGPGFGIPIFALDGHTVVQEIDQQGEIRGFVRCEAEVGFVRSVQGMSYATVGQVAMYAFESCNGATRVGSRVELAAWLRDQMSDVKSHPFVFRDVAEFLGDKELITAAQAQCAKLLAPQIPLGAQLVTPMWQVVQDDAIAPKAILREQTEWGLRSFDLVNPASRFWSDQPALPPAVELGVDSRRVRPVTSPAAILGALPDGDNWAAQSRRSVGRLRAFFLIAEDPQRRLDAREVETLSHQVSMIRHVLDSDQLGRVLIADEVGLGKTIEVGLLLKELFSQAPGLRVLYLAPAKLVGNVRREFERLGLNFRQWTASEADARLSDQRVIASIHRAVHGDNFKRVVSTSPWDVVVVDECHHLSAWSPAGGDPRERYRLVRDLISKQDLTSRLILLSGTPHQGHKERFENLLSLLLRPGENASALRGRVIYRTKDDVRDWHDQPLFPRRQVNEPVVLELGAQYRAWIEAIHEFYRPSDPMRLMSDARRRAAGWRCAQALQWAASSPHAGLGYLARQAIRAGWTIQNALLAEVLAALRPYRLGRTDEPIAELFARMRNEILRQQRDDDVEDLEDDDSNAAGAEQFERKALEALLSSGLELVLKSPDIKWEALFDRVLRAAGTEKVVLFAQPLETVTALARYLHRMTGEEPAMIIGGQSDSERQRQIDDFRRNNGPRYIVCSRAGGEGINLQIARRLVHIDIPWNPMEMEQRVGRVHRFGSRQTVIVDTLVVRDSREADAYRIAREKLRRIAATLVEPQRFETVFARVMALVPPEELQGILINAPPFSSENQDQIAVLVQNGFHTWREFHDRFGKEQAAIRQQDPGLAEWDDVSDFLIDSKTGEPASGYKAQRFKVSEGEVLGYEEPARVVALSEGDVVVVDDYGGAPVVGPEGRVPSRGGINHPTVAQALRKAAFPELPTGAAHLRWPRAACLPNACHTRTCGILFLLRQSVRTDSKVGWVEHGVQLLGYRVELNGECLPLTGVEKGQVIRCIFRSTIRTKPEDGEWPSLLARGEAEMIDSLRRPSEEELASGIRHAVTSLFAAVVAPDQ